MELWISPAMEPEFELVKRTYAKPEKRQVCMDHRRIFETLWLQQGWIIGSIGSCNGHEPKWDMRRGTGHSEVLRLCFRDRKQSQRCWRHFQSATTAIRQQEITFETEKKLILWKLTNGQNWNNWKLGPKICTPPDFGKGKPEQPEDIAHSYGNPVNISNTQRTLRHHTHCVAISTWMMKNWLFLYLVICSIIS